MGVGWYRDISIIFNAKRKKMNKKGGISLAGGAITALLLIALFSGIIPGLVFTSIPTIVWVIGIIVFLFILINGGKKR